MVTAQKHFGRDFNELVYVDIMPFFKERYSKYLIEFKLNENTIFTYSDKMLWKFAEWNQYFEARTVRSFMAYYTGTFTQQSKQISTC
jgi:hypothetical protein